MVLFSTSTFAFHRHFPSAYRCTGNYSDQNNNHRACAETSTRAIRAAHPEWIMGHGDRGALHYGIHSHLTVDDIDRLMPFYDAGFRFSEVGVFVLDERSPNDPSWGDLGPPWAPWGASWPPWWPPGAPRGPQEPSNKKHFL